MGVDELGYDEANAASQYLWSHHWELFTPFEQRVDRAGLLRAKRPVDGREVPVEFARQRADRDPAVNGALALGWNAFRVAAAERVLAEQGAGLWLNRCPACQRIVRTPRAQQCLWCGHDWHGIG